MQEFNPLLGKVKLPGKVFQLPSKGLFYKPGDILASSVLNGEVQVKAMSALTEMKLRSADLLISGKVFEEVCQECISEVLKPAQMLVKDVDALFCFLVAATYGDTKTVNAIHNCEKAAFHDYKISLDGIISNPRNQILDHLDLILKKELSTGQVLNLKMTTFEESLLITFQRQEIMKLEIDKQPIPRDKLERMILDDVLSIIASVEDVDQAGNPVIVTDRKQLEEWLRSLTRKQIEEITTAGNAAAEWGFNYSVMLKCKDCEVDFKYDLELNPVSFFSG